MNYQDRRIGILQVLRESDSYISASKLAEQFGVTRQIIVSDIAILRANGHQIIATRHGYHLARPSADERLESIICKHRSDQVLDEFYAVIDNGGSVLDVIVGHPLYGELRADLNIASRYDAQEFTQRMASANASLLSDLTGGLHIHTLRIPDDAAFERILEALRAADILVENAES